MYTDNTLLESLSGLAAGIVLDVSFYSGSFFWLHRKPFSSRR
ncbi:MAG: hypothetical protein OQK67_00805 [Chlorobium sp.]|nr:hypothetical protein [Chlorobium sp.]